ncbi:cytochrome D1 domain-containing protein [Tepidiphilus succinatimandens]|uniref:cytochrome D1 domain-containing protein n=1 Tax=Tepidiphilus succinatimandens TaxID=224436 RepID=UPI00112F4275|nr:cytochrome D1 domain-containing protein [Tepidiphilus succinatimandens]
MDRRAFARRLSSAARWFVFALSAGVVGLSGAQERGTGDLGVVIERASGSVLIVAHTTPEVLARVEGLGDLSHASVVFSRDQRFAYVFGRDGALTKLDLLRPGIVARVQQAGNSIGGAISQDGRLVVAQNYEPGGIKAFSADDLHLVAEVPTKPGPDGKASKVVGLADLPGQRFAYALFDAGEICVSDFSVPDTPRTECASAGRQPYDGLVTPDGRFYLAGLFGEDGVALWDSWHPEAGVRRILDGYGRGETPLPVYKMPHLRGWAQAGERLFLPAIGRHEVLVVDRRDWRELGRVAVAGQPVFVMARPDGREIWVNFAFPDNGRVQVIDAETLTVRDTLEPGRAVLHMEFTPKGDQLWVSCRDDDRIVVYDARTHRELDRLAARSPSGIFFTYRATRFGM